MYQPPTAAPTSEAAVIRSHVPGLVAVPPTARNTRDNMISATPLQKVLENPAATIGCVDKVLKVFTA